MNKVRLLKVIVQPQFSPIGVTAKDWPNFSKTFKPEIEAWAVEAHFAYDKDGYLEPIEPETKLIPAHEWATYSSKRFKKEINEWQKKLDKENE